MGYRKLALRSALIAPLFLACSLASAAESRRLGSIPGAPAAGPVAAIAPVPLPYSPAELVAALGAEASALRRAAGRPEAADAAAALAHVEGLLSAPATPVQAAARRALLESLASPLPAGADRPSAPEFTRLKAVLAASPEFAGRIAALREAAWDAAPEGASASPAALPLSAVFDGSAPRAESAPAAAAGAASRGLTSRLILARARREGISYSTLGKAIAASSKMGEAAERLRILGLLKEGEFLPRRGEALNDADPHGTFSLALASLWARVRPALPSSAVSRGWDIPALTAVSGGVTYFIHGLNHGAGLLPPGAAAVRAFAARLAAMGRPLYSEEGFPWLYGYGWGRETLDHRVARGEPIILRDAGAGVSPGALRAALALTLAAAAALPLLWLIPWPASPLGWLAAALYETAVFIKALGARLGLGRLGFLRRARRARREGAEDLAEDLERYAEVLRGPWPEPEALVASQLPMPLRASQGRDSTLRSLAMAEAVAAEAAASGQREVHLLVGANHAPEVAAFLAQRDPRA